MSTKNPKFRDLSPIGQQLLTAAHETSTHHFTVHRETIQPGKTFSREAMEAMFATMNAWVEARVMARWEETGEPPTVLHVSVTADAQ